MHWSHEGKKLTRYPLRDPAGRILLAGDLVPVVLSTLGGLGKLGAKKLRRWLRSTWPGTGVPRAFPALGLAAVRFSAQTVRAAYGDAGLRLRCAE